MKILFAIPALVALTTAPAFAQQTRSKTVDGPNYSGTQTITVDPTTKTYAKDGTLTRKSDGAVATRQVDAQRTDAGITASGSSTGFNGKTSSFNYDRVRSDNGSSATGTFTGRNGGAYAYNGNVARNGDGTGYTASQGVTGPGGTSLYNRNVTATRDASGINRSVTTSRAPGLRPGAARARIGRR